MKKSLLSFSRAKSQFSLRPGKILRPIVGSLNQCKAKIILRSLLGGLNQCSAPRFKQLLACACRHVEVASLLCMLHRN